MPTPQPHLLAQSLKTLYNARPHKGRPCTPMQPSSNASVSPLATKRSMVLNKGLAVRTKEQEWEAGDHKRRPGDQHHEWQHSCN